MPHAIGTQAGPALRGRVERNELVVKNLRLVGFVVNRLRRQPAVRRLGDDDAWSAGAVGLIRAADLWDAEYGVSFGTYAYRSIAARIRKASRQEAFTIRLPEWLWQNANEARRAAYRQQARAARHCQALSESREHAAPDGAGGLEPDDRDSVHDALRFLDGRTRRILRLRYWDGLTLQETSERVGLTRERVRELQALGLGKLRQRLGRPTCTD